MMKMMMMLLTSQVALMKNQMTMILMIILSCLAASCYMFSKSMNHWMSMLPILIYVSGIMVLFMFIVSLTPNEKTTQKPQKMMMVLTLSFVLMFTGKNLMNSEKIKMNSVFKWNLLVYTLILIIILTMAYLPPKILKALHKGMKSSK